jgi:hypothetical protein
VRTRSKKPQEDRESHRKLENNDPVKKTRKEKNNELCDIKMKSNVKRTKKSFEYKKDKVEVNEI